MEAVRFESVTKDFSLRDSLTAKDFLLGIAGHRPTATRIRAIDDLSFSVEQGETLALLGHNGSGKSTTLKMLAGVMRPSAGIIRARGRIAPLLELGAGFHPDLTARENIYLNGAVLRIPRRELRARFDEIVSFAGVEDFLDTPVRFFSSGMSVRLGFAIAVSIEPDILLVDEVLSVGDTEFQEKSLQRMHRFRDDGTTVILVTHDRRLAADFCSRGIVLEKGRLVHDGPVEAVPGVATEPA